LGGNQNFFVFERQEKKRKRKKKEEVNSKKNGEDFWVLNSTSTRPAVHILHSCAFEADNSLKYHMAAHVFSQDRALAQNTRSTV